MTKTEPSTAGGRRPRNPPTYVRDSRSPPPSSAAASRVMSANRARDTGPELFVRQALRQAGLRGYRLHPSSVPGRPDITFIGAKVAIFVHGCFWHACPTCTSRTPRANSAFWRAKFVANRARDAAKEKNLRAEGWHVFTVWEHEIPAELPRIVGRIRRALS